VIAVILKPLEALGQWLGQWLGKLALRAIRKHNYIPKVAVNVSLSNKPHWAHRSDIFSIVFSLTSVSGITKVVKGSVRFYNPDKQTQGEEQKISARQLFEGKTEDFLMPFVPLPFYDSAMLGKSTVKAQCNLTLERPNGETHQQDKQYTYDWKNRVFEEDHG
jgi:hypothetical protein